MSAAFRRVADSVAAQGLMRTLGCGVVTAEFKINLMRPAIGRRFLAIGRPTRWWP